ncbi:MAG: HRDC domain-containing protein, partial [Cyanobium sp.]
GSGGPDLEGADAELMAALRSWRLQQARQQGVPPYVVFHDRTLLEIAARRPDDLETLGAVSGVGQAKLARYGAALLKLLREGGDGAGQAGAGGRGLS